MVSIKDRISQLLCCDGFRDLIEYRHMNFSMMEDEGPNKLYTDIFSGRTYETLVQSGHFKNVHDIALAINIDGFSSRASNKAMVIVDAVVLNLPPWER